MDEQHTTPSEEELEAWQRPTAGPRMFTFGLTWHEGFIDEEIDVWARSHAEAKRRATAIADAWYEPDYTMSDMDPGGSAGTFTVISI